MALPKNPNAAEILHWRGRKSYGLIAKEFGVTRNIVAGIFFRADHPGCKTIGTGQYSTPSKRWARKRLPPKNRYTITGGADA